MASNELIIKIGAESKKFQDALNELKEKTEDLEGQLASVAKVSAVAFAALTAEVFLSVKAYGESEAASNALTQALQNQGIYSADLAENYKAQAEALQKLTGIDDDAIVSGQAVLQGMIGQVKITKELTAAAVELGHASGGDVSSGFEILGRAIQGNTRGLKQFGIEIDEGLSKQERMAAITELVTQKLGGQAAAANQGIGGMKGLSAAFADIQEEIGKRFAPVISVAIKGITDFLIKIKENKPLFDFAVSLIAGATAAAGITLAVSAGALAFLKFKAALIAAQVATSAMSLAVKGLIGATGIGLLVVVATEIYLNWSTVFPRVQAIFQAFVNNITSLGSGLATVMDGLFTFNFDRVKEGMAQLKATLAKGFSEATAEIKPVEIPAAQQDQTKEASASAQESRNRAREQREEAAKRAHNEVLRLQAENASAEMINLARQEAELLDQIADEQHAKVREDLVARAEEIRLLKEEQRMIDAEQQALIEEEYFAHNEEFQALSEEQQEQFKIRNQAQLQSMILTEDTARQAAAKKSLQDQINSNNQRLLEQQRFGVAYATINQAMHSAVFQGSKTAFGELAQLTQSSNATLKQIGKVAAVASIVIKTAESAMNIYAGFSAIPIIGPALGLAGAAAAIAFGAEQVSKVTAAAEGGLMTGGIPGVDSIPVLAQRNELIAPAQNFEEVIGSVRAQREAQELTSRIGGEPMSEVLMTLRSIDEKLEQPSQRTTIFQGDVLADEVFIDTLIRRISDRVEFGNAVLITNPTGVA